MSSKVSKKNRFQLKKPELSERNQKLKEELAAAPPQRNVMEGFTKWRMITYAWLIFLPPYGLYRVWSKESTFTRPERVVWTFMMIVYMLRFLWVILLS
ncbi:MAG: hypothetical protein HFG75_14330 [Hungatella sp.]|nr:hypothetical protein [Hungatella sp.]